MLTVIGGLKSAAGVTTCAMAWAYRHGATVVEADPAGGDVAGWWAWPDAGLSDLAATAVRHGRIGPEQVAACTRVTRFGASVVAAPLLPRGAARSVAEVVDVLPKAATDLDLVVDVGRVDPTAVTGRLLAEADRVVLLVPPVAGELARLRVLLPELARVCGDRLSVVLSRAGQGGPPWFPVREVVATLGCPIAGVVPFDPRTAAVVAGWPGRLPGRGRLGRWARWRWPLLEAVTRW